MIQQNIQIRNWKLGALSGFTLLLATTMSNAETLTVFNDALSDTFVNFSRPGGVGDSILWNSAIETKAGENIGTGAGTCQRLDYEGNYYCNYVLIHRGHGTLSVSGVQVVEPGQSTFVITGGTGAYLGAKGEVLAIPVENRARFRNDIHYALPKQ